MIKIAYIIDHLKMGGAQRHLLQVVQGLNRDIYAPEMWTSSAESGDLEDLFRDAGVPVRNFGIGSTLMSHNTLLACRSAARDLRERDVQILHGYLFEGNFLAAITGLLGRRPVVLVSKRSLDRYDRWDRKLAAQMSNRLANRILVNSTAVRDIVLEHEKCPLARIEHIPNGVPPVRTDPTLNGTVPEIDPRGDGPLVGMVGRLGWKKGYEYALESFRLLADRIPNVRVDIVGAGDLREELEARTATLGLDARVRFLGQQTDVARRMQSFDCYVLSSVIEGMPNALLEAMALGRPVVTTTAGGSRDVVVDEESGLLVPPRDPASMAAAIERVLTDDLLAERMARGAAARIRDHFSEEAMLSSLHELYQREAIAAGLQTNFEPPRRPNNNASVSSEGGSAR